MWCFVGARLRNSATSGGRTRSSCRASRAAAPAARRRDRPRTRRQSARRSRRSRSRTAAANWGLGAGFGRFPVAHARSDPPDGGRGTGKSARQSKSVSRFAVAAPWTRRCRWPGPRGQPCLFCRKDPTGRLAGGGAEGKGRVAGRVSAAADGRGRRGAARVAQGGRDHHRAGSALAITDAPLPPESRRPFPGDHSAADSRRRRRAFRGPPWAAILRASARRCAGLSQRRARQG